MHTKERPSELESYRRSITGETSKSSEQGNSKSSAPNQKAPQEHVNHGSTQDEAEKYRRQHFQACNPPQPRSFLRNEDTNSTMSAKAKHHFWVASRREENTGVDNNTTVASTLTQEGKRQVRHVLNLFVV